MALGAVLLLAFGLRAFHLGSQALTGDEAWSLDIVSRSSLGDLLGAVQSTDVHPPLYYVMLYGWGALAGRSEYAARFLSLGFDLLSLALLTYAGATLFGRRVAITVAVLVALSPISVFYAQEARMYALLVLLTLSSSLFCYRFLARGRRSDWLGYVAITALALFTHYFALFIVAFQDLFFLLRLREHPNRALRWTFAQLILALSLLPWFLSNAGGLRAMRGEAASEPFLTAAASLVGQGWSGLAVGVTGAPEALLPMAIATALLMLTGLVVARRSGSGEAAFLALYLAVPFATMVAATAITPYFFARYLLVAAPAYYLLVGLGLNAWRPMAGTAIALAALSVGWASSLNNLYFDPSFAKPDYRALVREINASALPEDALVLGSPLGRQIHSYYYHGSLQAHVLFDAPGAGSAEGQAELAEMARQYPRLWVIPTSMLTLHDPGRATIRWLAENAYKAIDYSYGRYPLYLYATENHSQAQWQGAAGLPAEFGGQVRLERAEIGERRAMPRGIVRVRLQWRALSSLNADYKVALHLVDRTGKVVAQRDAWPVDGFRPTSTWAPGDVINDRLGLWMPGETPAGEYQLRLILYSSGPGLPRLPVSSPDSPDPNDFLPLGHIVVPSQLTADEVAARSHPQSADFGDQISLLGYAIEPPAPTGDVPKVRVRLFWQATGVIDRDYTVFVHVLDKQGQLVTQGDGPPAGGYSTSRWSQQEIVEDIRSLELPPGAPVEGLQIKVGLYYPATMERLPVTSAPGDIAADGVMFPLETAKGLP